VAAARRGRGLVLDVAAVLAAGAHDVRVGPEPAAGVRAAVKVERDPAARVQARYPDTINRPNLSRCHETKLSYSPNTSNQKIKTSKRNTNLIFQSPQHNLKKKNVINQNRKSLKENQMKETVD
jgi:hypothetical protein